MTTLYEGAYEIAAARITGAAHRAMGRGCQDGSSFLAAKDGPLVAVVTDGCGSSPHSEVGALLGAAMWTKALADECESPAGLDISAVLRARETVAAKLSAIAEAMPGRRADVVRDFLLFTTVGVAIDCERAVIFAIGDGIIAINGNIIELASGPGNAPSYLAYELCAESRGLGDLSFIAVRPAHEVKSLVLATDGASALLEGGSLGDEGLGDSLIELAGDDATFANRDHLRRRLERLAAPKDRIDWDRQRVVRGAGRLQDDATIIAIRARIPASSIVGVAGAR